MKSSRIPIGNGKFIYSLFIEIKRMENFSLLIVKTPSFNPSPVKLIFFPFLIFSCCEELIQNHGHFDIQFFQRQFHWKIFIAFISDIIL